MNTNKVNRKVKNKIFFILSVFFIFIFNGAFSQNNVYSVSVKGNYTTTARLYPLNEQNDLSPLYPYYSIDNIYGYGLEVRRRIFTDDLFIGLAGEYVFGNITNKSPVPGVYYNDGFDFYLLELNGILVIPFSTEKVKVYIGGGVNSSLGTRKRTLLDVASESVGHPISFGIQVLTGIEYIFLNKYSVRWEMKFRDPMVDAENKFNVKQIKYNNVNYNISSTPFKSKINLDGIAFELGISYLF
jgi:hypothetical protein